MRLRARIWANMHLYNIKNDIQVHLMHLREKHTMRTGVVWIQMLEDEQNIDFKQARKEYDDLKQLQHYINIGKEIGNADEVVKFKSVLSGLNQEVNEEPISPFALLTSSSGTGKTQFPFAFDKPYLYFIYNTYDVLGIRCFHAQSVALLDKLLRKDYKVQDKKRTSYHDEGSIKIASILEKSHIKYKTVGFIVAMLRRVVGIWKQSGGTQSPAEIQYSIKGLTFSPMTVLEGRKAVEQLIIEIFCSEKEYYLPIFFDDCYPDLECSSSQIYFLRSLIRAIKANPVFIGMDAKVDEYIKKGKSKERTLPMCLVWFKFPGLPEAYFIRQKLYVEEKIMTWNAPFPSQHVIDFLFKNIRRERPLFLTMIIEIIEMIISKDMQFDSDYYFLEFLFEEMLRQFRTRRDSNQILPNDFNFAQLEYLSPLKWNGLTFVDNKKHYNFLYFHFGYLNAIPDDPNCPWYCTLSAKVHFDYQEKVYRNSPNVDFDLKIAFESINEATLTNLICTGISGRNCHLLYGGPYDKEDKVKQRSLRPIESHYRLSVVKALYWISHSKWDSDLENTLLCAAMYAARAGGFSGCSLKTFLEYLFRELDLGSKFSEDILPPAINLDSKFLQNFSSFKVPFLFPTVKGNISDELHNDLKGIFGEDSLALGTAYPFIKESPADFVMMQFDVQNQPNPIMLGQCHMYLGNVNVSDLDRSIQLSFSKYPSCMLFLVVAPAFTDTMRFSSEKYSVWKFVRDSNGTLTQEPLNELQLATACRHVLLLELEVLYSGKEGKEYFDDKMDIFYRVLRLRRYGFLGS